MGLRERAEANMATDGTALRHIAAAEPVKVDAPALDVTDSGIPAGLDVPVHVAWSRVMGEVQFVAKGRHTTDGARYSYRGIDDVMDAVAGAFRKHGVFVVPAGVEPTFEIIKTAKGASMNYCRSVCHFTIYGPNGDSMPGATLGEGFDSGDKSGTKAQSVAYRTFLIEALNIPVNQPQYDTEHGPQHEIAGPRRPTVAEYTAEILDERTSINRLSQIKAELDGDRSIGAAEVEMADGERIALVQLVRRVGRSRAEN